MAQQCGRRQKGGSACFQGGCRLRLRQPDSTDRQPDSHRKQFHIFSGGEQMDPIDQHRKPNGVSFYGGQTRGPERETRTMIDWTSNQSASQQQSRVKCRSKGRTKRAGQKKTPLGQSSSCQRGSPTQVDSRIRSSRRCVNLAWRRRRMKPVETRGRGGREQQEKEDEEAAGLCWTTVRPGG